VYILVRQRMGDCEHRIGIDDFFALLITSCILGILTLFCTGITTQAARATTLMEVSLGASR
jgi:hypothetical protein